MTIRASLSPPLVAWFAVSCSGGEHAVRGQDTDRHRDCAQVREVFEPARSETPRRYRAGEGDVWRSELEKLEFRDATVSDAVRKLIVDSKLLSVDDPEHPRLEAYDRLIELCQPQ